MAPRGRLEELRTELGHGRHKLPVGEFEDPRDPPAVVELEADGIVEHFEGASGPRARSSRGVPHGRYTLFICRDDPKYAVNTLLAPQRSNEPWKAWIDRYETWSALVEAHPEFGPRGPDGRRPRPKAPEPSAVVQTGPVEETDAAACFI